MCQGRLCRHACEAPFAAKDALRIAGEIAEALDKAHKRRVVHRDLKPSNVMLTEQGHVKVMDFGLARQTAPAGGQDEAKTLTPLTQAGVRVGTPAYMSPEQLLGGAADERSDIFAFGIVLYELLACVHPFSRSSQSGTMSAIVRETPPPLARYAKRSLKPGARTRKCSSTEPLWETLSWRGRSSVRRPTCIGRSAC